MKSKHSEEKRNRVRRERTGQVVVREDFSEEETLEERVGEVRDARCCAEGREAAQR